MYQSDVSVGRDPPSSETVLTRVKELLYIPEDHHEYDKQILAYINGSLVAGFQIGIVTDKNIRATDESLWSDVFREGIGDSAEIWLSMRVRRLFDTPQGAAAGIIAEAIEEETYRLREQVESEVFNESE